MLKNVYQNIFLGFTYFFEFQKNKVTRSLVLTFQMFINSTKIQVSAILHS